MQEETNPKVKLMQMKQTFSIKLSGTDISKEAFDYSLLKNQMIFLCSP